RVSPAGVVRLETLRGCKHRRTGDGSPRAHTRRRIYTAPVDEIIVVWGSRDTAMEAQSYVACLVHVAGNRYLVLDPRRTVERQLRLDRVVVGIVVGGDFDQRGDGRAPVDGENGVEIA